MTPALRQAIVDGAYWLREPGPNCQVVVAYTGAVAPEAIQATGLMAEDRRDVGLLAITSADRLNAGWTAACRARERGLVHARSHIERLFAGLPRLCGIVSVLDGHPATLAWLGAVHGHRVRPLGVEHFGQTGSIEDLDRDYGIDAHAIIAAAETIAPGRPIRYLGELRLLLQRVIARGGPLTVARVHADRGAAGIAGPVKRGTAAKEPGKLVDNRANPRSEAVPRTREGIPQLFLERLCDLGPLSGTHHRDRASLGGRTTRARRRNRQASREAKGRVSSSCDLRSNDVIAMKRATLVILIVFASSGDPVGTGLAGNTCAAGGRLCYGPVVAVDGSCAGKRLESPREV